MAITAIPPNQELYYVPFCERDPEKDPSDMFALIMTPMDMDSQEVLENESVLSESKGYKSTTKFTMGTQKKNSLIKHVKGWYNLNDPGGNAVPFDSGSPISVKKSLDWLPVNIRDEAYYVLTNNFRALQPEIDAAKDRGVPPEQLEVFFYSRPSSL